MMYGNKLAAAIKVNGRVLREFKDEIYIPFGSEYAITLKNLNTTRAVVNVFIDGDNVVPGGLVLNVGQSVDLERSIKNNNLSEGNKFKFIERTDNIEQHRGIGVEDGLVRIEYQFEQQPVPITQLPNWQRKQIWDSIRYSNISAQGSVSSTSFNVNGVLRNVDTSAGESMKASATSAVNSYCAINNINVAASAHDGMATMDSYVPQNDAGITVPGSKSEQKFQTAYVGALESVTHNLVFKLIGDLGFNKPVTKPVTVKHKPKCVTCVKQNKHTAKFCAECGTALEIFA